jgi:Glyoxalase-like domain
MAARVQVVLDCSDPRRLAEFWALALGYEVQPPPEGFESWEAWLTSMGIPEEDWNKASAIVDPEGRGPRIFFQRVPEPKTVKNRMHLDVYAAEETDDPDERRPRIAAEVERLIAAGATYVRELEEYGQSWVTLQDPEGNEFDVA